MLSRAMMRAAAHYSRTGVPALRLALPRTTACAAITASSPTATMAPPEALGGVRMMHETRATRNIDVPEPMDVFDQIDANGDGVLSREEFALAVEQLSFDELVAISKSLGRNELSRGNVDAEDDSIGGLVIRRLTTMADVTVSKIFPAGFGWQTASVLAEEAGHAATELPFFLYTGAGDFTGVLTGHVAFSAAKKAMGSDINLANEFHTGLLLGTAAFCSGFAWQPSVNALVNLGASFNVAAGGTVVACGTAFFVGLRLGRGLYGRFLDGVEEASYANLKADVGLSISIGGATGAFVGTDVSFGDYWLRPVVGIEDGVSNLVGEATAGFSTALGFVAFQTVQSFTVPAGKCWVD